MQTLTFGRFPDDASLVTKRADEVLVFAYSLCGTCGGSGDAPVIEADEAPEVPAGVPKIAVRLTRAQKRAAARAAKLRAQAEEEGELLPCPECGDSPMTGHVQYQISVVRLFTEMVAGPALR